MLNVYGRCIGKKICPKIFLLYFLRVALHPLRNNTKKRVTDHSFHVFFKWRHGNTFSDAIIEVWNAWIVWSSSGNKFRKRSKGRFYLQVIAKICIIYIYIYMWVYILYTMSLTHLCFVHSHGRSHTCPLVISTFCLPLKCLRSAHMFAEVDYYTLESIKYFTNFPSCILPRCRIRLSILFSILVIKLSFTAHSVFITLFISVSFQSQCCLFHSINFFFIFLLLHTLTCQYVLWHAHMLIVMSYLSRYTTSH